MSSPGEFELIAQYFARAGHLLPTRVVLGIGDDCALLQPTPGMQWAISSDMLVSGRHFFPDVSPRTLGHKALAVNLSDLAACGAKPVGFTLALSLPDADADWLREFSQGLFALADAHDCPLVGGDTTRGPLNICITVFGEVPPGQALLRSGARAGDDIWVSGTLGDAAQALHCLWGRDELPEPENTRARQRLEQPSPRVALSQALRGVAHAAADVSDGLLGDLGHILKASGTGAELQAEIAITLIAGSAHSTWASGTFDLEKGHQARDLRYVLCGGDDYELVFTAPPARREAVVAAAAHSQTPVTRIGRVVAGAGVQVLGPDGQPLQGDWASFDHFKAATASGL
jgi:thiamine-monophosphate kinase